MIFKNPQTGTTRIVLGGASWLWCLLFGWLYYAFKGMWGMAFISLVTLNGLFVVMPILNSGIVQRHYENMGWVQQ